MATTIFQRLSRQRDRQTRRAHEDWMRQYDQLLTYGCIAYREDGTICGAPASVLDTQRGGMVCTAHAPKEAGDKVAR